MPSAIPARTIATAKRQSSKSGLDQLVYGNSAISNIPLRLAKSRTRRRGSLATIRSIVPLGLSHNESHGDGLRAPLVDDIRLTLRGEGFGGNSFEDGRRRLGLRRTVMQLEIEFAHPLASRNMMRYCKRTERTGRLESWFSVLPASIG